MTVSAALTSGRRLWALLQLPKALPLCCVTPFVPRLRIPTVPHTVVMERPGGRFLNSVTLSS